MSAKTGLKAVFFDLDGTLVDTELAAARAIQEVFASWSLMIEPTDAETIIGRTWQYAFDYFFKKYKIPVPRPEGERQMLEAYAESLHKNLPIVAGGAAAVRALSAKYPLALVSGSMRHQIFFALGQLGITEYFKVILGAEDYPRSKPAPDGYAKAMKLLSVEPESTLIFEDSEAGIASALAAGATVVAITGTNHFRQNNAKAQFRIADLTSVDVPWVEKTWRELHSS
jgi:HAD superfamily hydrolase (TIGR01509 family)